MRRVRPGGEASLHGVIAEALRRNTGTREENLIAGYVGNYYGHRQGRVGAERLVSGGRAWTLVSGSGLGV